jgi:cell division protein FtsN
MEKDKLEKFVIENRSDFDAYEPSPEVWDKIFTQKPLKVSKPLWIKLSRYAAVAAVTLLISFITGNYFSSTENKNNLPVANNSGNENFQYNIPELTEAEAYYSSMVKTKINEIGILTANNPEVKQELDYDLQELEQIYSELKDDLADNAGNEEVIEAMIQNYRTRLEILEGLLRSLKNEKQKRENNENNSVSL